MVALKHYKYNYKPEISPKSFFEKMIKSNKEFDSLTNSNSFQNDFYSSIRSEITGLVKKINSTIENNSSTYYLSLLYIDKIFRTKDFYEYLKEYNKYKYQINSENKKIYIILSISCLIIASKFNENDPHYPGLDSFLKLCNSFTNYIYSLRSNDLVEGEIIALKLLKYKLNYFSVYHFLAFFFGHGVILDKTLEKMKDLKNYDTKKILEKIYILSREILDLMTNENTNEFIDLLSKSNNYVTVAIILNYSIEMILHIKLDNNDNNVFMGYYNIKFDVNMKQKLFKLFKNLYINKIKNKKNNNIEKNNSNNNEISKNSSFRRTYSTVIPNFNKNQFNNFSLYSSINDSNFKDENIKNSNNNYMSNISNYKINQNYYFNYNEINNTDFNSINNKNNNNIEYHSHISYGKNNKIYLNYDKKDETKDDANRNKINSNELRKSLSMNQLQNKISSTENNNLFENKVITKNENINKKSNSYFLNKKDFIDINNSKILFNNKIDTYKKNIYILDKDINNNNNYLYNEVYSNNNYANTNTNKYISLKKFKSFNKSNINNSKDKNEKDIQLLNRIKNSGQINNINNIYENNKYKVNNKYYLKNILSAPMEPMSTTNVNRQKLIQKTMSLNDFNYYLQDIENENKIMNSKSKEKKTLYDVIEKTKKIFNMNSEKNLLKNKNFDNFNSNIPGMKYDNNEDNKFNNYDYDDYNKKKNTIIINNNININNYIDKKKFNNYFNQNNKVQNLINNNFYHKLNMNKANNKLYFDNKKDSNKKINFNYNINYNSEISKYNNVGINKTNRQSVNYNAMKNNNKYINTYYDYSNEFSQEDNSNDILSSHRKFSYYKQNNGYYE